MKKQGISLVVCCHNSAQRLPPTLEHLKIQTVPANIPWEVIVVDNASTDQTAETALSLWGNFQGAPLRVVSESKLGLINARKRGFQEAQYEFVSFIDDDNWVAPDWVNHVYDIMVSHPEVGACGGRSEAVFEQNPPSWFQEHLSKFAVGNQAESAGDVTWSRGYLWGAGLTIRKSAWEFLVSKGFSPLLVGRKGKNLSAGEDSEICLALRLAGWRLWYDPALYFKHYIPAKRMNWHYLRCLVRGFGASSVALSIYKMLSKGKKIDQLRGRSKKFWVYYARISFHFLWEKKGLYLASRHVEGNHQILEIDYTLGKFLELIRQNEKFDANILALSQAEWNLLYRQEGVNALSHTR